MTTLPNLMRGISRTALLLAAIAPDEARSAVPPELQRDIDKAIDRGIDHLQRAQHRDGSWTGQPFGSYRAGPTAFTAYALVESGVSPDAPSIQMALDFLERNPPRMTYSAGALLLLLAEIGGDRYLDLAEATLHQLIDWENQGMRGAWSYPSGPVDLSNTQFVALGFLAASRLGIDVPLDVTRRMVETTIKSHQEEPRVVDGPPSGPGTGTGTRKRRIGGFTYFPDGRSRPASASMTAAGVGIQRIARLMHGRKLGGRLLRKMETSEALGIGWLGTYWAVDTNHGHPDGGQVLYYLWAIERLGAYLDTELIEGHRWYEEGAVEILSRQKEDGGWERHHQTSYALLFLARATRPSLTGASREVRDDVWDLAEGPVRIRATGSMRLAAWITSLDPGGDDDLRVARVEWFVDDEVVATIDGDASRPWRGDRYPLEWTSERTRTVALRAVVHGVRPDGTRAEIRSQGLSIRCAWTPDDWMTRAAAGRGPNLLHGVALTAKASSEAAGQHAARVADGYEGTAWIASASDATPSITLSLDKSVRASRIVLSHPGSSVDALANSVGATRIRLVVNGKQSEHDLPPEAAAPIEVALPKRTRVKTIRVDILAPAADPSSRRGFAEIGLR